MLMRQESSDREERDGSKKVICKGRNSFEANERAGVAAALLYVTTGQV